MRIRISEACVTRQLKFSFTPQAYSFCDFGKNGHWPPNARTRLTEDLLTENFVLCLAELAEDNGIIVRIPPCPPLNPENGLGALSPDSRTGRGPETIFRP